MTLHAHHRRRMTLLVFVAAAALVSSCDTDPTGTPTARAGTAELAATVDAIVQSRMAAELIPGVVVSVVDPERGDYTHAYGVADVASGRAMTVDDRFRVGSVTKSFTATAVLQLADAGKLSLDDTLDKYVDGVPRASEISIRDLLGMRGGVYDYSTDPEFAQYFGDSPQPNWTVADTLRVIAANPDKAQPPKTVTAYSNSEYYLLGLVIEKVTGKPVRDALNDVVIDELGLTETAFPVGSDLPAPASRGYQYKDGKQTDVTGLTPADTFSTAGAVVSTVSDMAKFAEQLATGELLKPETQMARTQFTDVTNRPGLEYGLGVIRIGDWIGHAGDVAGYSDMVFYLPERDVSVVVAVNLTETSLLADSASIWVPIVNALYPGTVSGDSEHSAATHVEAVPDASELDGQLRQALDTTLTPEQKTLKVVGEEQDPTLISTLAELFAAAGQTMQVTKVTDFGYGDIAVTVTVTTRDGVSLPLLLPMREVDGVLKISRGWACEIVLTNGASSPACGDAAAG